MKGNDFVGLMLRSPLHVLMGNTMLITVTGRKTGRPITTPVNYYRDGDSLWIISTRKRTWWRNMRTRHEVVLHLNGKDLPGEADLVLEEKAVARQIGEYVRRLPVSARPLGVRLSNGVVDAQDAARAAKDRLFVEVCIGHPAT
jgi:deazaflavin-dependent oxidoreductase (nitroreductase family)